MRNESWNPLLKSYPDSDRVNSVSIGAEMLYTRLIAQSDDHGHYCGEPRWVLARLFTARMIAGQVHEQDIAGWLNELEQVGLIAKYQVAGQVYIELVNVKKCLRRDVKPEIRFPDRPMRGTSAKQVRDVSVTDSARVRDESGSLDPEPEPYPAAAVPQIPDDVPVSLPTPAAAAAIEALRKNGVSEAVARRALDTETAEHLSAISERMRAIRDEEGVIRNPDGLFRTLMAEGVSMPVVKPEKPKRSSEELARIKAETEAREKAALAADNERRHKIREETNRQLEARKLAGVLP